MTAELEFFCFYYPGDKPADQHLGRPMVAGHYMVMMLRGVYSEAQEITPSTSWDDLVNRAAYFAEICRSIEED